MKKIAGIYFLVFFTIGIICLSLILFVDYQNKNKVKLTTLDSSLSIHEDDALEEINLSDLTIIQGFQGNLIYTILSLPEHGNVFIGQNSNNEFFASYTPEQNYYGNDQFTYQVSNGEITSTGAIRIRVESLDDAPKSHDTHLMTYENSVLTYDLSNIVSDIDSNDLIYTIPLTPRNGLLEINGQVISYTPNPNFTGLDSFDYVVYSGIFVTVSTISIEVISNVQTTE